MPSKLSYGRQSIDEDDISAVVDVLRSNFLTTGPTIPKFEGTLAETVGATQAVAVNSGTAALHLAMLALKIGPGDQVIVPSITFLASANAAAMVGAEVIFSDVDPDLGIMRPQDLALAITRAPRAKAAVIVHLNGVPADMPVLREMADEHGIRLVEDACHALGSEHNASNPDNTTSKVGSCRYSDMATFSFHPVKAIATGEGGAVTSNDPNLIDRLRLLRNHGMRSGSGGVKFESAFSADGQQLPWIYEMRELGWNYRLNDIQAALGTSQLSKLKRFVERRRKLVGTYDEAFKPLSGRMSSVSRLHNGNTQVIGWHLYPILCHGGAAERLALFEALVKNDIRPQVHYFPVHRQPYYHDQSSSTDLPGADTYYARVLSLPLFVELSEIQQSRVIDVLTNFFNKS